MKTSLKYLSLILAVSLPTIMLAEAIGLSHPSAPTPTALFGMLVISFLLLTVVSDYTRAPRFVRRPLLTLRPEGEPASCVTDKACHALAA